MFIERICNFSKHPTRYFQYYKNAIIAQKKERIFVKYKKSGKIVQIKSNDSFEHRNNKTASMVLEAFRLADNNINNDFSVKLYTGDSYEKNKRILAYSKKGDQSEIIPIPDFSFVDWKECGIDRYDVVCNKLLEEASKEPEHDTLLWIGNAKTHPSREKFLEIAEGDDRIEAYGMQWDKDGEGKERASKYISLFDHAKWKYLIDIQGRGWSARTKFFFFTGRPLFLVDRQWKEFWYSDIKPFVHYIPVKEDLSDLTIQLDWAEVHPEECSKIAQNAMEFAKEKLTYDAAIKYLADVLIKLGNE